MKKKLPKSKKEKQVGVRFTEEQRMALDKFVGPEPLSSLVRNITLLIIEPLIEDDLLSNIGVKRDALLPDYRDGKEYAKEVLLNWRKQIKSKTA